MRFLFTLIAAALLIGGLPDLPAGAQTSLDDEFDDHDLNWRYWCSCQIDMKNAPVELVPDPNGSKDGIARITVDETSLGGNLCRYKSECQSPANSHSADYGPLKALHASHPSKPSGLSLFRPPENKLPENPYCTEEVMRRAVAAGQEDLCIQRQELRLKKPYQHETDKPHLYSMRFRMPASVEDRTNSIRWVIAQWKQEPLSDSYKSQFGKGEGPSPFLAQRFDDGVLHITVQDEFCRCRVASAPNPDGSTDEWRDGPAQYCVWTKSPGEGKPCRADLQVKYGANPILPSPLGQWVEMSYRVEAGRSGKAAIEVYAGKRFIVRITGEIGYQPNPHMPSLTKFKVGHYRDYMPFVNAIEIDWLKVEPVNEKNWPPAILATHH
jgi:Polysaccharide lyase